MSGSDEPSRPLVSRRTTLRAGALGAAVAWTVPLVQVISMDSASAASGAPSGSSPGRQSVGKQEAPRGSKNNRGQAGR